MKNFLSKLFSGGYYAGVLLIVMFILDLVGLTSKSEFGVGIAIILFYWITLGFYNFNKK